MDALFAMEVKNQVHYEMHGFLELNQIFWNLMMKMM